MSTDFDSYYPQKPFLEEEEQKTKGHISMTLFSMLFFFLSIMLLFDTHIAFIGMLVLVVFLHEMGHFLFMKRFRYENVRLLFIPLLGAFVHGNKEQQSQRENLLIYFAGPIPGVVLGAVAWIFGTEFNIEWMHQIAILFFSINLFNLLPILPMDGGRILTILFFKKVDFLQVVIAFVTSMLLIGIGFYLNWYMLMIIGLLMGFQVRSLHRKYLIRKGLNEENVDFSSSYPNLSNRSYHFMKNQILEHTPGLRKFVEQVDNHSESDELVAREVKNMLLPPMQEDLNLKMKVAAILLWILSFLAPVFLVFNSINE